MGNPSFLILGAMRSGTTTLYYSLCSHSKINKALSKETNYYWKWYDSYSFEWYQKHFVGYSGEASHNYMLFSDECSQRIHNDFPDAKLIAILRNPVDRAYSHYHLQKKWDDLPFEHAIDAEIDRLPQLDGFHFTRKAYLKRGDYANQLAPYVSLFGRENILALQAERFFKERQAELTRVFSFLGFESEEIPEARLMHISYPKMDPETRVCLSEYFEPLNEALYELIGERFDW